MKTEAEQRKKVKKIKIAAFSFGAPTILYGKFFIETEYFKIWIAYCGLFIMIGLIIAGMIVESGIRRDKPA